MNKEEEKNYITWLYIVEYKKEKKKGALVYGMSLPTNKKLGTIYDKNIQYNEIKEYDNRNYKLLEIAIHSKEMPNIQENDVSYLDLSILHEQLTDKLEVVHCKDVTQLGHIQDINNNMCPATYGDIAKVKVFYTTEFEYFADSYFFDKDNIKDLHSLINVIENKTRLPFNESYARRLGCLEQFDIPTWVEKNNAPFELVGVCTKSVKIRFNKITQKKYFVHVTLYDHSPDIIKLMCKDIIADKIEKDIFTNIEQEYSRMQLQLFDDMNEIIYYMDISFTVITQVSSNIHISNGVSKIDTSGFEKNNPLRKLKSVSLDNTSSTMSSISRDTTKGNADIIIEREIVINNIINDYNNMLKDDKIENVGKFFKKEDDIKEIEEFLNVLNTFAKKSNINRIVIVDAYFSNSSLNKLIAQNSNAKIEVLTTSAILNDDYMQTILDQDKMKKQIKTLKEHYLPIGNINIYMVDEKHLHDRFIILLDNDDIVEVYSLSNSFNSLLHYYSFSLLPLKGNTKLEAEDHIKYLLGLCIEKNNILKAKG